VKEQESIETWANETGPVELQGGLALFPLDDELVIFFEERQSLIGLNSSAAFVFRKLQEGMRPSELARALASARLAQPGQAERWMAATLDALSTHGLLRNGSAPRVLPTGTLDEEERRAKERLTNVREYVPFEPVAERHYRLLQTHALIRFAHPGQVRLVDAVLGHLATQDRTAPDIVMDIQALMKSDGHLRSDIYRDGKPVGYAQRLSHVAPEVKAALWQSAVNAYDFLFYFHAGVVRMGESCVLLPAASGSGKSSLTAALTHHGFCYYSDEVALIERTTFHVPPVPLALAIKSTGWDLLSRYYPDISALPVHVRLDSKKLRYVPPPAGAALQPPAPVSHIIFPRHEKDAPTELRPVARAEALGRLMTECLALRQRLDLGIVTNLVGWIAQIDCYELTFSSLEDAVELVAEVAACGTP
jgi:hypothetical protein